LTARKEVLLKNKIADALPKGKGNGVSAESLVALYGLKSTRELRREIHRERMAGALIASDESGYFIPQSRAEINAYLNRHEKMAISIFASLKAARNALREVDGQIDLGL
jgi:predicted DNA-binding transcriptional regulator YafY